MVIGERCNWRTNRDKVITLSLIEFFVPLKKCILVYSFASIEVRKMAHVVRTILVETFRNLCAMMLLVKICRPWHTYTDHQRISRYVGRRSCSGDGNGWPSSLPSLSVVRYLRRNCVRRIRAFYVTVSFYLPRARFYRYGPTRSETFS